MPDEDTKRRAAKDKREGKSASTQAGEFVREEIHHIREGKHGARSAKQAIAIGLSKARRAGVELPPPPGDDGTAETPKRKTAKRKTKTDKATSKKRSRAAHEALEGEGTAAASKTALSRHASAAARTHTAAERSASAKKAARTKGAAGRKKAARKAAKTRAENAS